MTLRAVLYMLNVSGVCTGYGSNCVLPVTCSDEFESFFFSSTFQD